MILGLQIIALIFALIMLYFANLHYRRGELNGLEILAWLVIWVGAILIVLFPNLFSSFAKTFAISRVFDLAVIGGFILVISLVYSSYINTKKLEKKINDLIRNDSLGKLDQYKNK